MFRTKIYQVDFWRIAVGAVTVAVALYLREPLFIYAAAANCLFSILWLFAYGLRIIDQEENPTWALLPAASDVFLLALLTIFTGSGYSVFIVGYAVFTSISSLNPRVRQGLFVAVASVLVYVTIITLTYLEVIPPVNLLGPTMPVTLLSLVVSAVLFTLAIAVSHKVVHDLTGEREEARSQVARRTEELERTLGRIQELKTQQDGDYFLTTLLASPLFRNRNRSPVVRTEFHIEQYKKFRFRKWDSDLGGDQCVTGNLLFDGMRHTMFFNGDAMGKSMQGAGGALVMGSLINAIMARSAAHGRDAGSDPETWLRDIHVEIQRVFEAFDGSMYVSCVVGLVNDATGRLYYLNAEHPYSVLYRAGKAAFLEGDIQVQKIGFPDQVVDEILASDLQPGDVLIVGSDGRDDLEIGHNERGDPIMNVDDRMFLEVVEEAGGRLAPTVEALKKRGRVRDDLSLIRIAYDPAGALTDIDRDEQVETVRSLLRQRRFAHLLSFLGRLSPADQTRFSYYRALALTNLGRYNEAAELLSGIENMVSGSFKALLLLGESYERLGNRAEAVRHYERALAIRPDHAGTLERLRLLHEAEA